MEIDSAKTRVLIDNAACSMEWNAADGFHTGDDDQGEKNNSKLWHSVTFLTENMINFHFKCNLKDVKHVIYTVVHYNHHKKKKTVKETVPVCVSITLRRTDFIQNSIVNIV